MLVSTHRESADLVFDSLFRYHRETRNTVVYIMESVAGKRVSTLTVHKDHVTDSHRRAVTRKLSVLVHALDWSPVKR